LRIIAVTGASGFIGRAVSQQLLRYGYHVRAVSRSHSLFGSFSSSRVDHVVCGDLVSSHDLTPVVANVNCIIHAAARVPFSRTRVPELDYSVNVEATRRLAQSAVDAGVERFVFLSSVRAISSSGEGLDSAGRSGRGDQACDGYGASKRAAEQALWDISAKTGLGVVVVRPPLVYGSGVKGHLAGLLKLLRFGLPLPLGALQNKRSLIGLDNLVDLLIRCVDHPAAVDQTFLVSDGEDLSTPDLLRHMAAAMGRPARLVPVPVPLLRLAGSTLGKGAEIDRLVGSLQIDISHTRQVLGWTPPVSVREGIRRMVQGA